MARRLHAECSNGERTRATNQPLYTDDACWQRRKRNARKTFQSDGSADSDIDEHRRSTRTKQRDNLKSRRHYNTNYSRAKDQRHTVSSGDSDTATLTVTDTSDASTSSGNSKMTTGRHKVSANYRSYDNIVCNSEHMNYAKCKRNVSDDCVPPERFVCVQKYTPAPTSNNRTTPRSANEMMNFVTNLFKQLGNTSSAIAVNKTSNNGGQGNASLRQHPPAEEISRAYTTDTKQAINYAVHSADVQQRYAEQGAINCALTKLYAPAETTNHDNNNQPQNYQFQNYLPISQAGNALTSSAHGVSTSAPASQQQQLHAPHGVTASTPPSQQQQRYAEPMTTQTYVVAANLTPTVQPVHFAPTKLTTHVVAPNNYTNYRQVQRTSAAPPLQLLKHESPYRSAPVEFVLSRGPIMPQSSTKESLVDATYITPPPTEVNGVAGIEADEQYHNAARKQVGLLEHYPTSFIYTGSDIKLVASNFIEDTAPNEHQPADVTQTNTLNEQPAASYSDTHLYSENQMGNLQGETSADMRKDAKKKRCKCSEESNAEEDTSSCNSEYIRECLRKQRHKRKSKEAEKNRKKGKCHRNKESSDNDSDVSSDDYAERRSKYNRKKGKRHKRNEQLTPNESESDDEMGDRFSKTSCKHLKKCCSRIVAICRKARDTAGTQTDECCECAQDAPKATTQTQCSCSVDSDIESDIQSKICASLANADQNAIRKIAKLSREKKKCKVYTCGAVGENGAEDDMIIIKFEADQDTRSNASAQPQSRKSATRCKSVCNYKPTESETEMIEALIRKKRVYEKIKKACSLTSVSSERCACADEGEFMDDLLRQQRLERLQNGYDKCVCNTDDKAKEDIMKELIRDKVRSKCAAEVAQKASESFAKCLRALQSEDRNCREEFEAQKDRGASSSDESSSECLCALKSEPKLTKKQSANRKGVKAKKSYAGPSNESFACLCGREPIKIDISKGGSSKIRAGDCTCNTQPNEQIPQKGNRIERKPGRNKITEGNARADDCACSVDKNKNRPTKTKPATTKRTPSSSSKVSNKMSARDARCTCNDSKNERGATKPKSDKSKKLLEIEINASSRSVRGDKNNARTNNCTCQSSEESASAQPKSKRTLKTQYSDSSEISMTESLVSMRAGQCTCKPSKQSTRTLNMNKSGNAGISGKKDARETKSSVTRNRSKIPAPIRSEFSSFGTQTCRSDCACKGATKSRNTRALENVCESESDYEERNAPSNPKRTINCTEGRTYKEATKICKPHCACKQKLSDSSDDIDERILPCQGNMDEQSSGDDESLCEGSANKSIQKLIIDIKASKEGRASCTLIAYPQSINNAQRFKSLADAEQSARNKQTAALCAELAMNELMPQHSLRTLLTKLSSPNGKLFNTKNLEASAIPHKDIDTFSVDQSETLSLKKGRNGRIKPTMIMSQAIRVTGKQSNSTQDGEPVQFYKKKVLKLTSSAPSLVLTSEYANKGRSRAGHTLPIKEVFQTEASNFKPKLKKSLIPLPVHSLCAKHSKASGVPTLVQSESAETRSNTRPLINQASDSNHHIMRLWPELHQRQLEKQRLASDMSVVSQCSTELADETGRRVSVISASYRLESGTEPPNRKLTRSSSKTKNAQSHTKSMMKLRSGPLKMVEGANESQVYAKRSSESSKSSLSQKLESKHRNSTRKTNTKSYAATPATSSNQSIDYEERQNSTATLVRNNKKRRVTRFRISETEQRSDSEVECCSLDYTESTCDEYEMELERKGKLWREGTVREALEVEERESERTKHWQPTTLTGESLERAINYPTSVWNEERKQLNLMRNGGGIFSPF